MKELRNAAPHAVAEALAELGGAALVLDARLSVVLATERAEALLGFPIRIGESAPKILCGGAARRPVAEALAAGRPVTARIRHPGAADERRQIAVRSVPLGARAGSPTGWLLLLEDAPAADADGAVRFHGMWTQCAPMKELFRLLSRVAVEDVTVLVRGETGAGKELVAQAIHALSPRAAGPLRVINCAALPGNLLESELFGHARGAFTGAVRDVPGHVELAHRGTLFLDEVAELPLELQAKLLRVIETKTVVPVGGRKAIPVDVRIVSATHRALRKEVEEGRFRADLMFRLRVIPMFLPPLRERPGDVRLLTGKIVEELNAKSRRRVAQISPAALDRLERYDFPGNVRELRNVIAYAFVVGDGPILVPGDLPPEILAGPTPPARVERGTADSAAAPARSPEAARIASVLERVGGNRERAARVLGMSRVTLWRRMREAGLSGGEKP
ncbi:MAG: sigma 54-interacting transcriptional regulator [Polyangiaceae bacterium]